MEYEKFLSIGDAFSWKLIDAHSASWPGMRFHLRIRNMMK